MLSVVGFHDPYNALLEVPEGLGVLLPERKQQPLDAEGGEIVDPALHAPRSLEALPDPQAAVSYSRSSDPPLSWVATP